MAVTTDIAENLNIVTQKYDCGKNHTILVKDDGSVFGFGNNKYGQLGVGNYDNKNEPTYINKLSDIKITTVGCGSSHTIVISEDGDAFSFGSNYSGKLGLGNRDNYREDPTQIIYIPNNTKFATAKCGHHHSILISKDGHVFTFGDNRYGQLGLGGRKANAIPIEITRLPEKIINADCGYYHTVLLSETGRVFVFGNNIFGQLGTGDYGNRNVPTEILFPDKIVDVSCGENHTILISENNKVYVFGDNSSGQLGLRMFDKIGMAVELGFSKILQTDEKISSSSCGKDYTMLITNYGRVNVFGANNYGQLGLGYTSDKQDPDIIEGIIKEVVISNICCGSDHTVLISSNSTVYTTGNNNYGQLGIGNNENKDTPTIIPDFTVQTSLIKAARKTGGNYQSYNHVGGSNKYYEKYVSNKTKYLKLKKKLNYQK